MSKPVHWDVPVLKQGPADCVQHSFSLAMRGLGLQITAKEIIDKIPVNKRPDGTLWGTSPAAVAAYLLSIFPISATALSSDVTVTDFSWIGYSNQKLEEALQTMLSHINEVALTNISRENVEIYANDYLTFVKNGGTLKVGLFTIQDMKNQLANGPLVTTVLAQHFYKNERGRWYFAEDNETQVRDSILGRPNNHTIVISGYTENGFTVVDPFTAKESEYDFEHIITSIAAAQIESDNVVYCFSKK